MAKRDRKNRPHKLTDPQLLDWMVEQGVRTDAGCLEWPWLCQAAGYGRICYQGKSKQVHRLAYQIATGESCEGLVVRHRCDNPKCFALEHLELGTMQNNMDDKVMRGRAGLLSNHEVAVMRNLAAYGIPVSTLSRRFSVAYAVARNVIVGATYTHVGGPIRQIAS